MDGERQANTPGIAQPLLSVITPAYNESESLLELYARLKGVLDQAGLDWEWIVVDDHSADATFEVIACIARADSRVRGVRFAKNQGSHKAISCGLHLSRGMCAAVMAADLQDPPETMLAMIGKWREGAHVVWAVRAAREGEKAGTVASARLYYWIMRYVVGIKDMPSTGADFFLVDAKVVAAYRQFEERSLNIVSLITWMGFRQERIFYTKHQRVHGTSGWTFSKKLKLAIDSVTSFSYVPLRLMSCVGFVVAFAGFAYAASVIWNALSGSPVPGWSSLMVVVLILGGGQMLMMGILGEYIWRALDESRRRPQYWIEDQTESRASAAFPGETAGPPGLR